MAKLSRESLKEIVKECLVEILQEGLASPDNIVESSTRRTQRNRTTRRKVDSQPKRPAYLDNIQYGMSKNSKFEKSVDQVTKSMTQDPVLSSILADTAMTTLQEQAGAESRSPGGMQIPTSAAGDLAAKTMSQLDPTDVFAESSDKWAALAFSDSGPKR